MKTQSTISFNHFNKSFITISVFCLAISACGVGTSDGFQDELVQTVMQDDLSTVQNNLTGDLNGDSTVDVVDFQCMILVQNWMLGGSQGPAPECIASREDSDLNCDGKINVLDYAIMIRVAVGGPLPPALDANGNSVADACEPTLEDLDCDGDIDDLDQAIEERLAAGGALPPYMDGNGNSIVDTCENGEPRNQ